VSNCTQTSEPRSPPPTFRASQRTFSLRHLKTVDDFRLRSKTAFRPTTSSPTRRRLLLTASVPSSLLALSSELAASKLPATRYKVTTV
jgi:hypothetical protein